MAYTNLNPGKALIWRITHRHNLPWILANGLHAGNSPVRSSGWMTIGNLELIDRRAHRPVPLPPHGMLNDYVPFYFTPFSPMLYNIHTGRGGVAHVANADIVILVSSLHWITELGVHHRQPARRRGRGPSEHRKYGWCDGQGHRTDVQGALSRQYGRLRQRL
jgi:hypothetical protein